MIRLSYRPRVNVLHIENDPGVHDTFRNILFERNIYVHSVDNLEDAKKVLKRVEVNIVISDGVFPSKKGGLESRNFISLVNFLKKNRIQVFVIPWLNSPHVHEYCRRHAIRSYSKLQLTREHFREREMGYFAVEMKSLEQMADMVEGELRKQFGFYKGLPNRRFVETYKEPSTMLVVFLSADTRTRFFKETAGLNYGPLICEINDGLFTFYLDSETEREISERIFKKILKKGFYEKVSNEISSRAKRLLPFARSLKTLPLGSYSNVQFAKLYLEFCRRLIEMRMYSSLPMALEHQRSPWTNLLLGTLSKKITDSAERNRVLSVLTSPEIASYVNEFQKAVARIGVNQEQGKDIDADGQNLLAKYEWVHYTVEGEAITKDDIFKKIDELRKEHGNLGQFVGEQDSRIEKLKQEKTELIERYGLSAEEKRMFDIGAGLVYLKFFRKGVFAESYYSVEFLLEEIGKRIGCSRQVVVQMLPHEVLAALKLGSFPKTLIASRMKESILWCHSGESYPLSFSAREVYESAIEHEVMSSEIKGQVAYSGIARGPVKIVNIPSDMENFNRGDVLVSRSTNPSLISAMQRASAFVTDTGGLTCHAAIVAREMKKPCIVGTKFATKILKDGNMVEVDAKQGIVKVVS